MKAKIYLHKNGILMTHDGKFKKASFGFNPKEYSKMKWAVKKAKEFKADIVAIPKDFTIDENLSIKDDNKKEVPFYNYLHVIKTIWD
jgi:hypothetical protein